MALGPMREVERRKGTRAESKPIWMLRQLRFAKPYSTYDTMVKPRAERSRRRLQVQVCRKLVASSSETHGMSERSRPGRKTGRVRVGHDGIQKTYRGI